jgi:hypothetical protein
MMVSMALVIFVMVILSYVFAAGLETFRGLKAIGDMEDRMRSVTTFLRRDLSADHFDGKRRLSDVNFFAQGPPREGFFRIWNGSAMTIDGVDADGIPCFRATNHALHMAVKLRGNTRQDFFYSVVPAGVMPAPSPDDSRYEDTTTAYNIQWADVVYFLRANGSTANGTPLFALYRRQQLAVPNNVPLDYNSALTPPGPTQPVSMGTLLYELSCKPNPAGAAPPYYNMLYFNSASDLTVPCRRFGMSAITWGPILPTGTDPNSAGIPLGTGNTYPMLGEGAALSAPYNGLGALNPPTGVPWQDNPAYQGADLMITDVLSFEIKVATPETIARAQSDFGTSVTVGSGPRVDAFIDLYDTYALYQNSATPPATPSIQPLTNFYSNNAMFYNPTPAYTMPPMNTLPAVFDTWSSVIDDTYNYSSWSNSVPSGTTGQPTNTCAMPLPNLRILAVQITIRVWDQKSQGARQYTFVQEM